MLEALQHHQERFGTKQSTDLLGMLDKPVEANQELITDPIRVSVEVVKDKESIRMLVKSPLKVSRISKDIGRSKAISHNQAISSHKVTHRSKAIHSSKDTLSSKANRVLKDHLTG